MIHHLHYVRPLPSILPQHQTYQLLHTALDLRRKQRPVITDLSVYLKLLLPLKRTPADHQRIQHNPQ